MSTDPFTQPEPEPDASRTTATTGCVIAVALCTVLAVSVIWGMLQDAREAALRTECKGHLKGIGVALHNYVGTWGGFPPAYTVDANGRPLHSWRTLILPFLEEDRLYAELDFSKPWNDPHNLEAFRKYGIPPTYQCPSADLDPGLTTYMAIVGPSSGLHPTQGRPLADFTDGTTNLLLVVDVPADQAIFWAQPDDVGPELFLEFNSELSLAHRHVIQGLHADGAVQVFPADMPSEYREALLSIDGGEDLNQWNE